MGLDDVIDENEPADETEPRSVGNTEDYPEEDAVCQMILNYFVSERGYTEPTKMRKPEPDLNLKKEDELWRIEVEGWSGKDSKPGVVYTGLGQIIYHMEYEDIGDASVKWCLALPLSADGGRPFVEKAQNISKEILDMLSIYLIFVDRDGNCEIFPPGEL